jgi:hypothetical protein
MAELPGNQSTYAACVKLNIPLHFSLRARRAPRAGRGETKRSQVNLARNIIESVDWSSFELQSGLATGFGHQLGLFIENENPVQMPVIWRKIENHVFSQGEIYSAAEPTIRVLFAALVDAPKEHAQLYILDLLFQLTQVASCGSSDLAKRCLREVQFGVWLLIGSCIGGSEELRNASVQVLELCAPGYPEMFGCSGA